jgi:hypothetical protein
MPCGISSGNRHSIKLEHAARLRLQGSGAAPMHFVGPLPFFAGQIRWTKPIAYRRRWQDREFSQMTTQLNLGSSMLVTLHPSARAGAGEEWRIGSSTKWKTMASSGRQCLRNLVAFESTLQPLVNPPATWLYTHHSSTQKMAHWVRSRPFQSYGDAKPR